MAKSKGLSDILKKVEVTSIKANTISDNFAEESSDSTKEVINKPQKIDELGEKRSRWGGFLSEKLVKKVKLRGIETGLKEYQIIEKALESYFS